MLHCQHGHLDTECIPCMLVVFFLCIRPPFFVFPSWPSCSMSGVIGTFLSAVLSLLSWEVWFPSLLKGQALTAAYGKHTLCALCLQLCSLASETNSAFYHWVPLELDGVISMGKLSPGCLIDCELTHPGPLVKVTHLQKCLFVPKELFT